MIEDAAHGHHLENLSDLGIRLAIDDFGTGYSSFSYLKRLPVDFLKLDRSLIKELGHNPQDAAIVSAVVGLARDLGISSIAEGVEEPAQKDVLRSIGCDIGQGFWWAQPLPAPRITQLLRASHGSAGSRSDPTPHRSGRDYSPSTTSKMLSATRPWASR